MVMTMLPQPPLPVLEAEDRGREERKRQVAAQLGEEASRMQEFRFSLRHLRDLGALVDINVRGTTMFTTRNTWAELGISEDDVRASRLTRGYRYLVPEEIIKKLRSLETRFRQSLEKHSFSLGAFGSYRWVPCTAYSSWKREWAELQAEWEKAKEEIITRYPDYIDALRCDFSAIAREAWESMAARHHGGRFAVLVGGRVCETLECFAQVVVESAVVQLPTADEIRANLVVDYQTAFIFTEADVQADVLREAELRTAQETEWAKQTIQREQVASERRRLEELELHERLQLEVMRRAEVEHAKEQLRQMAHPLQEVMEQLREQIYAAVVELAESIRRNGCLKGKAADRARGLLDTFQLLNAHGDKELENMLQTLRNTLDRPAPAGGKHDVAAVHDALRDIADLTRQAAHKVAARSGQRFSTIEV